MPYKIKQLLLYLTLYHSIIIISYTTVQKSGLVLITPSL